MPDPARLRGRELTDHGEWDIGNAQMGPKPVGVTGYQEDRRVGRPPRQA